MPDRIPASEDLRAFVTKPLLDRITDQSIDSDYAAASDSRGPFEQVDPDLPVRRPRPGFWAMVVVAVFALLATTAAVQTSRTEDVRQTSRQVLIDRIEQRQDRIAELHREISRLSEGNQSREAALNALRSSAEEASSKASRSAQQTGFASVTGEGIRITIDNAADGSTGGTVRDSDLAVIVNGLWEAGAEAVSVDGQRVTPRSGISTSGSTLRMNDVSLSPPYEISALGDKRTLPARFAETVSGLTIRTTTENYDMPFEVENIDQLTLPAAPQAMTELNELGRADGTATTGDNTDEKSDQDSDENTEGDREE